MSVPRYKSLVEKSVSAALSAIEIYNKPDFKYREETFSILMINAWELLLKARVLKESKSDLRVLYRMVYKTGKRGNQLKSMTPELNRSGNPKTIGLPACILLCEQEPITLDKTVKNNINLLTEIRDTAIHFQHTDLHLSKKVFEIGTASLRNYLVLIKEWFDYDLSKFNFFLMPITFFHDFEAIKSHSINSNKTQIENLLKYISQAEKETPSDEHKEYNISLQLETKFVKSSSTDALLVKYTKDAADVKVTLHEEDVLKKFPLDYKKLTAILKDRYTNFKENNYYHQLRKDLAKNKKYCKVRELDPDNPKSIKKEFYNTEIVKEFDKHYKKK